MKKKLVSVAQAAQILGISNQGVHYRIKKNKLQSIKKNNKVFVYIDEPFSNQSQDELIVAKDEQIKLLKQTLKEFNKRHKKEIKRLQRFHLETLKVFKSEIDLLKDAFVELKQVYKLENKTKIKYISLKDFIKKFTNKGYTVSRIKTLIISCIKKQDYRFLYDNTTKEILVLDKDLEDLESML